MIIDKDKLTLHPLMRKVPSSVRAETPSDVKVVVWVETERVYAFDLVLVPESSRYTTTTAYPAHKPPPPGAPSIPAYKANWKVTVIDLESAEIRRVGTFDGPDPPGARITFQSKIGSDQICVYDVNERVDGAEILWGKEGEIVVSGRPVVGIVGAVPWDETLQWIKEVLGVGQG